LNPWGTCEDKSKKTKDKSIKLRIRQLAETKPRIAGTKVERSEDPALTGEKDKSVERRSFVFIAMNLTV